MLSLIQRVISANVSVNSQIIGKIDQGIMALVAVERDDNEKAARRLLERILNYRIFSDTNDRMNLSLRDIQGGLLLIPQFTLAANTESGNRPSFTSTAAPYEALKLFNYLQTLALDTYPSVQFGQFGSNMQVTLINDGPVTFSLRSRPEKP